MDQRIIDRYRHERQSDPWVRAETALAIARMTDASHEWDQKGGNHNTWMREIDGFEVTLKLTVWSIAPEVRGKGTQTDYGEYISAAYYCGMDPVPSEPTPMGLPAAHFKWPSHDRDSFEFFYPDDVEGEYEYYRTKGGCSASVARDRLCHWLEEHLKMLKNLENLYVTVTIEREGIELATAGIGTDVAEGDYDYIFADLAGDLVSEAMGEAREKLTKLKEVA